MRGRFSLIVPAVLMLGLPSSSPASQPQQTIAPDAGCMQHNGTFTCNWSAFQLAFDRAHTVALQTGKMDRPTAAQLRKLVAELGKALAPEGQSADLTFAVAPIDPNGVDFGPMDHDLARLKIFAPAGTSAQGTLLWAETYRGQGDRPWPAQVHALLSQFKDRFPQR